ncbi:hypothetical protein FB446DRAFT_729269 [Lentinula raphanica]|nr:hypothetical protein FB446DRAFT_729269 [Lentinula raphanica]
MNSLTQATRPKSSQRPELPPLFIPSTPSLSNGFSSSPPSSPALISWVASSKTSLGAADTIGTMLRVKLALTVNARLIIPCKPDLPKHLSNGGFIRSHPTVCRIAFDLIPPRHTHGSRFDSRRNSSMRSKPDSVSSSAKRTSPKSPSPPEQRERVLTTTSSHSASFELGRAIDPRDPSREDTAQRTTRPDGIQAIDELSPSVDPDTTRTAVPPKRLRRFRRVLSTLANLLQNQ